MVSRVGLDGFWRIPVRLAEAFIQYFIKGLRLLTFLEMVLLVRLQDTGLSRTMTIESENVNLFFRLGQFLLSMNS